MKEKLLFSFLLKVFHVLQYVYYTCIYVTLYSENEKEKIANRHQTKYNPTHIQNKKGHTHTL